MSFDWNDSAVATLKKMHAAGVEYAVIGERLGVSKSQVSGKSLRLGLERRPVGTKPRVKRVKRSLSLDAASARNTTQQAHGAIRAIRRAVNGLISDGPEANDLPPETGRVTLMQLEDHHCRFTADAVTFCGGRKSDSHPSYCADHAARCGGRVLASFAPRTTAPIVCRPYDGPTTTDLHETPITMLVR